MRIVGVVAATERSVGMDAHALGVKPFVRAPLRPVQVIRRRAEAAAAPVEQRDARARARARSAPRAARYDREDSSVSRTA